MVLLSPDAVMVLLDAAIPKKSKLHFSSCDFKDHSKACFQL